MSDSAADLPEKIAAHLRKTGYPLELETVSVLEERGWTAISNIPFFDADEEKHRECDVFATRVRRVSAPDPNIPPSFEDTGHALFTILAIECKKSDKPWVFFGRPRGDNTHLRLAYISRIENLITYLDVPETVLPRRTIEQCFWYFDVPSRSRNFTEAFKPENQPSQIWTALLQSVKALTHFQAQYDQDLMRNLTTFLIPIVVVDGPMFEARLNKGDISVDSMDHVVVELDILSKPDPLTPRQSLVDVVTRSYVPAFLERVDQAFDGLQQALSAAFGRGSATIVDKK